MSKLLRGLIVTRGVQPPKNQFTQILGFYMPRFNTSMSKVIIDVHDFSKSNGEATTYHYSVTSWPHAIGHNVESCPPFALIAQFRWPTSSRKSPAGYELLHLWKDGGHWAHRNLQSSTHISVAFSRFMPQEIHYHRWIMMAVRSLGMHLIQHFELCGKDCEYLCSCNFLVFFLVFLCT